MRKYVVAFFCSDFEYLLHFQRPSTSQFEKRQESSSIKSSYSISIRKFVRTLLPGTRLFARLDELVVRL